MCGVRALRVRGGNGATLGHGCRPACCPVRRSIRPCTVAARPYDEAPPSPQGTPMTTPPPSRRVLVGGALAASAVAATTSAPAVAGDGKKDGPPLLSRPDRHLVTRFSYGLTPD